MIKRIIKKFEAKEGNKTTSYDNEALYYRMCEDYMK